MTRREALGLLFWSSVLSRNLFAQVQQEETPFDPLRAAKAFEVGEFYMRRKNYDAAINRFEEAVYFKPNFARAYLRLGEAYEKALRPVDALRAYRKYVEILPSGKDAEGVKKRIAELEQRHARKADGKGRD